MLKEHLTEDVSISQRDFLTVFFLLFNTSTGILMTQALINNLLESLNVTYTDIFTSLAAYYTSIAIFAIIGGLIAPKVRRLLLLKIWTLLTGAVMFLPALPIEITTSYIRALCLTWGASFGVGIPACLAYLSDSTFTAERGRVSGTISLAALPTSYLLMLLIQPLGQAASSAIIAFWRISGLIILLLFAPKEKIEARRKKPISFSLILRRREVIIYLCAWFILCLAILARVTFLKYYYESQLYDTLKIIELTVGSVSSIIFGLSLDRIGRKRTAFFTSLLLLLGYAALYLDSIDQTIAPNSWALYSVVNGIAWGAFTVMFVLAIWGDLSIRGDREMYYSVGSTPPLLAGALGVIVMSSMTLIKVTDAFLIICILLLFAIVFLSFSRETLPPKFIEQRKLKEYIEKAKELT